MKLVTLALKMLRALLFLCVLCAANAYNRVMELSNDTNGCTKLKPCVKTFDTPKKVQVKCTAPHIMIKTWSNEEDVRVVCSEIAEDTSYIYVEEELTAVSPSNDFVYIYIKDL